MKTIGAIFITILTSLFFFPFNSSLMPEVNTKLAMSVFGLMLLGYEAFKKRNAQFDSSFSIITLWALAVSGVGVVSVLFNGTSDYTFATYIVSAYVWLSAAYVVIKAIRWVYGEASLRLVTNFLVAVCAIQCIISQLTDKYESVAAWVKSFVVSTGFMGIPDNRLYGIGCALDVAGLKFCAVLILLAYFALHPSRKINVYLETGLYILAFGIISVFGSMISRTTSVGFMIVLAYWMIEFVFKGNSSTSKQYKYFWRVLFAALVLFVPLAIYFYHTDAAFYKNLRFGFEGFFSLVETGKWEVRSNNQLASMVVWPDNFKTWIIGDGYFENPLWSNPYYIGEASTEYYMGTDVGYCRFVYYFGLVGLAMFCLYFINCAKCCSEKLPQYKILFWLILLMNFIGWYKVSSDIFPIFALLLLLEKEPMETPIEKIAIEDKIL